MHAEMVLITDLDMVELGSYLETRRRWPGPDREKFEALRRKVNRAGVVRSEDIPDDVVTLSSRVRVTNLDEGVDATHTLVLPARGVARDTVSVLSPLGVALLGRRQGDEIECSETSGRRRLKVEEVVYQPEAAARRHRR